MSIRGRVDVYCTIDDQTFVAIATSSEIDESGRLIDRARHGSNRIDERVGPTGAHLEERRGRDAERVPGHHLAIRRHLPFAIGAELGRACRDHIVGQLAPARYAWFEEREPFAAAGATAQRDCVRVTEAALAHELIV